MVFRKNRGKVDLMIKLGHQPRFTKFLNLAGRYDKMTILLKFRKNMVFLEQILPCSIIQSHSF